MLFLLKASNVLFSGISYAIAYRMLGTSSVGKVAFSISVVSFFSMVASLGIPTYGIRECAACRDDRQELSRTVWELFRIQCCMTLFSLCTLAGAVYFIPRLRQEPWLFAIQAVSLVAGAFGTEWLFAGLELYSYIAVRTTAAKAFMLALICLLVRKPDDYLIYAALIALTTVVTNVLNLISLRRFVNKPADVSITPMRHMKPVLIFFAQSVAITVYTSLDSAMLGFMSGNYWVGLYDSAIKIKLILSYFITSLGTVMFPRLSYYIRSGDKDQFWQKVYRGAEFTVLTSVPITVFMFLMADESLLFLFGEKFLSAAPILRILAPTLFFIGSSTLIGTQILVSAGKEYVTTIAVIVGALVDVILNLILIPRLHGVGAAYGTLVAEIAVLAVEIVYLKDRLSALVKKSGLFRVTIIALICAAFPLAVKLVLSLSSFYSLLLCAVIYFGTVYGILLYKREPLLLDIWHRVITIARKAWFPAEEPDTPIVRNLQQHNPHNKRIPSKVIYGIIAAITLVFMISLANDAGFWYDEFAQLCYSGEGKTLIESIMIADPTPPLFTGLANIWYHIMPYGQRYLLLLPQLALALAIYVTGLWGERIGNRCSGIWSALLLATSQMVMEQCGFEFRSYAFLLLFSALVMYLHNRWWFGNDKGVSTGFRYTLALTGLFYSHIFGALSVASLSIFDLAQTRRQRKSICRLIPYTVSGVLFLLWFIPFLTASGEHLSVQTSQWMVKPSPWEAIKLLAYLCNNNIFVCALFAAGFCATIVGWRRKRIGYVGALIPIIVIMVTVSVVYLYGSIRTGYASLWVKRYFTALFPCASVLCGLGVTYCASLLEEQFHIRHWYIFALLLVLTVPLSLYKTAVMDTPLGVYYHREAADWLVQQEDINRDDVLVLTALGTVSDGWYDYYVIRCGQREGFHVESLYEVTEQELSTYSVVYVEDGFFEKTNIEQEIFENAFALDMCEEEYSVRRYVRIDE
jgi:O-antigen/teichoic acid export membrane protein